MQNNLELNIINMYLDDMTKISEIDGMDLIQLRELAQDIIDTYEELDEDIYLKLRDKEKDISNDISMINLDEKTVKDMLNDIELLKQEKSKLELEEMDINLEQKSFKNSSILMIILVIVMLCLTFLLENLKFMFILSVIVAILSIVYVVYFSYKNNKRLLVLKKMKEKCVKLINSSTIKYVNTLNVLEVKYNKYGISNPLELSELYRKYLIVKKNKEKNKYALIEEILLSYKVSDTKIWRKQLKAFIDPEEFENIRNSLLERREKLLDKIEY